MTKKFELDRRIVDVLESFGWNTLDAYEYDDGDVCVELEWYSDKGEDFVVDFWFDGTVQNFANMFNEYYEQFDPEQHAVDWYGANRGELPSLRAF